MKALKLYSMIAAAGLLLGSCVDYHAYKGDQAYENLAYKFAANHYEKALGQMKEGEKDLGMQLKLAESYYRMNQMEKAECLYSLVILNDEKVEAKHYFNYGKALLENEKYEDAKFWLSKYVAQKKDDDYAKILIRSCNQVDEKKIDPSLYTLEASLPLQEFSNTYSSVVYRNGIVFSGDMPVKSKKKTNPWNGQSYQGLFYMEEDEDGFWSQPEMLSGVLQSNFNDGPACFSSDEKTVYFTRNNMEGKKLDVDDTKTSHLQIYSAELKGGDWTNLKPFAYNDANFSVGHPSLSKDGETLYFVSDIPGGYGGTDIYRCQLKEDEWGTPVNLGAKINTSGNEMFPFIFEDGRLFFSSDAHSTLGGLDIFVAQADGEEFKNVENMNYPLNSSKDDFGFTMYEDGRHGFISSTREGKDKLYKFTINDPTFNALGFAHYLGTDTPVEGVEVEILNKKSGKRKTVMSGPDGKFRTGLEPAADYEMVGVCKGCFATKKEVLSTVGKKYSEDFYVDFPVEKIILNKPIVMENILYDFNKWDIRDDAAVELNKLVKLLKENPGIHIELGSHTDMRGSDNYNEELSHKRARSAIEYIITQGIDKNRLTFKGYGEEKPIIECPKNQDCSEEEHQVNRRTEFMITKIDE